MCGGHMKLYIHDSECKIWDNMQCNCPISHRTWIKAHDLPIFLQCDECGAAPYGAAQAEILREFLNV